MFTCVFVGRCKLKGILFFLLGLGFTGKICMQVEEDSRTTSSEHSRAEASNQRKHCNETSFEYMTTICILWRSVKAKSHYCKVVKESIVKASSLSYYCKRVNLPRVEEASLLGWCHDWVAGRSLIGCSVKIIVNHIVSWTTVPRTGIHNLVSFQLL